MVAAPARPSADPAIVVKGDFAWGSAPDPEGSAQGALGPAAAGSIEAAHSTATLQGLDLELRRGRLVMVVGAVGAGKSSLLAAMLGEMRAGRGARGEVHGSV